MNNKLYFLLLCIPTRLLLAFSAYKLNEKYLPTLSVLFYAIGFSFLYLYITNSRLNAPEANGETWWKNLRPIHGMMYITAGLYAMNKNRTSALIILIDTLIGLLAFLNKRY